MTAQPEVPVTEILDGFKERLGQAKDASDMSTFQLTADDPGGRRLVAAIRAEGPQVIFILGSRALETVAAQIKDTPIVFGLVLSAQAIPGAANSTGVFLDFPVATQLDWLHRILPGAKNVGVIFNPGENAGRIKQARQAALHLGLKLLAQPIATPQELPQALATLANRADVLWGLSDQMVINPETARNLLLFSFRNRIPFYGLSSAWVKAGALLALDRDYRDIGRQCGELAQAILEGAAPETLPPQTPRRILYSLNRRTAKQMKIDIPDSLWRGAAVVY